jgi:hypothetical protein
MSIIIKELYFFEGFVISLGAGRVNLSRWQRSMERKIPSSWGWKAKKTKKFNILFYMKKGASGISGIFLAIEGDRD